MVGCGGHGRTVDRRCYARPRVPYPPDRLRAPRSRPASGPAGAGARGAAGVLARRRRRRRARPRLTATSARPGRRRRRLHRAVDGAARQAARPGRAGRPARGRHARLGRVGAQRRLLRGEPHPRRGERPAPLAARSTTRSSGSASQNLDAIEADVHDFGPGLRLGAHRRPARRDRAAPGRVAARGRTASVLDSSTAPRAPRSTPAATSPGSLGAGATRRWSTRRGSRVELARALPTAGVEIFEQLAGRSASTPTVRACVACGPPRAACRRTGSCSPRTCSRRC